MTTTKKTQNTWVLIVSGVAALVLIGGIAALNQLGTAINGIIRIAAMFGYLGVFLTSLSSNYMRELTRYFGRPFIKVHHIVAATSLVALVLHATLVAWRAGSASVFLPQLGSAISFLSFGGVPALWILAITVVTALLRTAIGQNWKTIHWLNYLAFILATIHAQLIGSDFNNIVIQIVSAAMALVLIGIFYWKRTRKRRAKAQAAKKQRKSQ